MSETLLERCAFLAASAAGNPTHYVVEQALEHAELDWRFLSFEVDEAHFTKAFEGIDVLGFRGVLLAPEFQVPVTELVGSLTPRAQHAGSVNCLVREGDKLVGDNTLGASLVEALGGVDNLADQVVLVIGHGRVARSMAAAACESRAAAVHVASRDEAKLKELAEKLAAIGEVPVELHVMDDKVIRTPANTSLVVFAPGTTDSSARPVIDTSAASAQLTVVDTRLQSSRTALLKLATEQGAKIVDGVDLFARETALALERWTGMTFDRAPLQESAEEFLGV